MSNEKWLDDEGNEITEEYVIISKTAIQKRIEELRILSNQPETSVYYVDVESFILEELEEILSQSAPLVPEIEKAFNEGAKRYCDSPEGIGTFISLGKQKKDYISNLTINL